MNKEIIISFPHLGDYSYFVKSFTEKITNKKVKTAPPITIKTISLGEKYSPNTVCLPFKYNIGNYIEALEEGANVLMQFGGGCRYGNYAELQETILKDLGYEFELLQFIKKGKTSFNHVYKTFKRINKDLTRRTLLKQLILIFIKIIIFDRKEDYRRKKIEKNKGNLEKLKYKFINEIKDEENIFKIFKISRIYSKKYKRVKKIKPILKIGIIGELYTAMEPFASSNLEKQLKDKNISIKRYTDVSYLLIYKKIFKKVIKYKTRDYLKYRQGADATENVYRTLKLKDKNYDGIIHAKPFGCTPEVAVMPILSKISNERDIPIMFLSFDTQTSNTGLKTRIEAYIDMLLMRKEQKNEKKSLFRNRYRKYLHKRRNNR